MVAILNDDLLLPWLFGERNKYNAVFIRIKLSAGQMDRCLGAQLITVVIDGELMTVRSDLVQIKQIPRMVTAIFPLNYQMLVLIIANHPAGSALQKVQRMNLRYGKLAW